MVIWATEMSARPGRGLEGSGGVDNLNGAVSMTVARADCGGSGGEKDESERSVRFDGFVVRGSSAGSQDSTPSPGYPGEFSCSADIYLCGHVGERRGRRGSSGGDGWVLVLSQTFRLVMYQVCIGGDVCILYVRFVLTFPPLAL